MRPSTTFIVVFLCLVLIPSLVKADPINFIAISTNFEIKGSEVVFQITIPHVPPFPSEDEAGRISYLTEHFNKNFLVSNKDTACPVLVRKLSVGESSIAIEGIFDCHEDVIKIRDLRAESRIFSETFVDVNHFIKIRLGAEELAVLLTMREPVFPVTRFEDGGVEGPAGINFFAILKQFVGLGIPHILFGLDHILFILAIHSIIRKFRDILIVVTSFTIAHSLTLILAGLNLITISGRIVEPLIAFSIAYTAVRNIIIQRRGVSEEEVIKERWVSTFGFGLIHGLGFAGAMAEIKIPESYFIPALLSFNVGVEIGQLIVIAVFISSLLLMRKLGRLKETVYILSAIIALVSTVWMVQRIFI